MKTREWLFTIAIIILIQFIVQVGALIYSNDNNVLNYISFAGTIVSIILAIIAIVYSFVQTVFQQSSSSNISNQVDKLISVVDQINDSKNIINTSIDHLKRTSEKLDAAIENQSNINKEVQTISKKFSDFGFWKSHQTEKDDEHQQSIDSHPIQTTIDNFSDWNNGTQFCMVSVYLGLKKKLPTEKTITFIVIPTMKKILANNDDMEDTILFYTGAITSLTHTLKLCNLMHIENNQNQLHHKLEEECRKIIEQTENTTEETLLKKFLIMYKELESSI